jgi:hypothetical protein
MGLSIVVGLARAAAALRIPLVMLLMPNTIPAGLLFVDRRAALADRGS